MKITTSVIAMSLFAASAHSVEWKDFDVNPMIGINVASEAHETSVPNILSYGAEVFYKGKYFVGGSYGSNNKITESAGVYNYRHIDEEFTRKSLWAGYLFDNGIAAKLGMTTQKVVSDYTHGGEYPNFDNSAYIPYEFKETNTYNTRYVMVGTGYYGEHLNMSIHYNIAASGEFNPYIKKSANNHINMMVGYRF